MVGVGDAVGTVGTMVMIDWVASGSVLVGWGVGVGAPQAMTAVSSSRAAAVRRTGTRRSELGV